MLVHALVATVGTGPEPAVFTLFDGGDEVFTDFVGSGFGIAVFGHDDLSQFLWMDTASAMAPWSSLEEHASVATYLRPTPPCRLSSSPHPPLPACLGTDFSSPLSSPRLDHG